MKSITYRRKSLTRYTFIFIGIGFCFLASSCKQKLSIHPTVTATSTPVHTIQPTASLTISSLTLVYTITSTNRVTTAVTSATPTPRIFVTRTPTRTSTVSLTITPTAGPTGTPTNTDTLLPKPTHPAHSPLIAFTMMTREGKTTIYTIHPNGSGLTPLDPGLPNSRYPVWSPDGQKLAYLSGDSNKTAMLTVLDYESDSKQQINYPGVSIYSWSPDSQRLVFTINILSSAPITTAQPGINAEDYYIYLVNLSDLRLTPLYKMPGNKAITDLDWAPQGDKILSMLYAGRPPTTYLRLFFLSGAYMMIDTAKVSSYDARWDPTGEWIAFSGTDYSSGPTNGLWTISTNGSHPSVILNGQDVSNLDWSPDGKRIAYDSSCCYQCCDHPSSIFVIDLDTKAIQPITGPNQNAYDPKWSPDGAYLAYLTATNDVDAKGYALNIYSFATDSVSQILKEKVSGGVTWRP